jgi:hypothetical protein
MEMVLRDPSGIKPGSFRMLDLLYGQTISFGGRRFIEKPREKSQSLQICEALHGRQPNKPGRRS